MDVDFFQASAGRSGAARRAILAGLDMAPEVTDDYRAYGRDYFDAPDLGVGYGGYSYDGRFAPAAEAMCRHYGLTPGCSVLEVGCAKGFALVEFRKLGMRVAGIDASGYAVENAHPDVRAFVQVGDVCRLPFGDDCFDLVLGKEVLPHVPEPLVPAAIRECMRVSKGNLFFQIQCGRTPAELDCLARWDRTHKTVRPPQWWDRLLASLGYTGDLHYKVLIPEGD